MNTSISLLSSTASRERQRERALRGRATSVHRYSATYSGRPTSQLVDHAIPCTPEVGTAKEVNMLTISAVDPAYVARRLAEIRRALDAPTRAKCLPRNEVIRAEYSVDGESGRVVRQAFCVTCAAVDVSGEHRRYGHRVA